MWVSPEKCPDIEYGCCLTSEYAMQKSQTCGLVWAFFVTESCESLNILGFGYTWTPGNTEAGSEIQRHVF